MAQVFHPATNTLSRVSIFGAVFFAGGLLWLLGALNRSPWVTDVKVVQAQPVPFSHTHHVAGLGLDCRMCHTSVESSASAGMPSSKVCMTCHSVLWNDAPMLEPVRESYRTDRSIEWVRVHDLPDFAYFDHSIHVSAGVACQSCHGRVDRMPLMYRENTLNMEWCLACHRDPAPHLRTREAVFEMGWEGEGPGAEHVRSVTHCSACHR